MDRATQRKSMHKESIERANNMQKKVIHKIKLKILHTKRDFKIFVKFKKIYPDTLSILIKVSVQSPADFSILAEIKQCASKYNFECIANTHFRGNNEPKTQ